MVEQRDPFATGQFNPSLITWEGRKVVGKHIKSRMIENYYELNYLPEEVLKSPMVDSRDGSIVEVFRCKKV